MKRLTILLGLLAFSFCSLAQTDQELSAADSLRIRARDLTISRQHDRALDYFTRASQLYLAEGQIREHFLSRISAGYQQSYLKQSDQAIAIIEVIVAEVKENSVLEKKEKMDVLFEAYRIVGMIYDFRGQLGKASEFFTLAQAEVSDSTSSAGMQRYAGLANNWGITYAKSGVFFKAKQKLEKALELYTKAETRLASKGSVLNNLGNLADLTGIPNEALGYYNEALDYYKELFGTTDNPRFGTLYKNMGDIYARMGLNNQALEYFKKSLTLLEQRGASANSFLAEALRAMGNIYEKQGDLARAAEVKQRAVNIALETFGENHPSTADAMIGLGELYFESEEFEKSIKAFERANTALRKLYQTEYERFIAANYIAKGRAMVKMGLEADGFESMQHGAEILDSLFQNNSQVLSFQLYLIGSSYSDIGRLDEALVYFQKSLVANSTEFKSTIISENPEPQVISSARILFSTLKDKAYVLERKYRQTDSIQYLRMAYKAVEAALEFTPELLKTPTLVRDKYRFSALIQGLNEIGIKTSYALLDETGDTNYLDQAFLMSELSKSSMVLSSISQNIVSAQTGLPSEFLEQEQNLEATISYLESQVFDLEEATSQEEIDLREFYENELFTIRSEYNNFLERLKEEQPLYYQVKFENDRIDLSRVQQELLSDGQLLLSYFVAKESLFLFQITKAEVKLHRIPLSEKFEDALQKFRNFLLLPPGQSGSIEDFMETNRIVSQTLLRGFPELTSFEELLIIPDGALNMVPFELLTTGAGTEANAPWYQNTLFASLNVSYLNSATIGEYVKNLPEVDHNEFAIALAPAFTEDETMPASGGRDDLGPLVWTGPEVQSIQKHFDTKIFLGDEATERQFRENAEKYSLIHVASHAVLNERDPFFSNLVMSDVNKDSVNDGKISAREIFGLSVPADLVVLSACNTGVGEVAEGEGVISLANSFFFAGSRSLVMTLWTANDQSTATIMDHFYENLSEGQPKSDALRNAKLSYLEGVDDLRSHPYYWAHFVVNGDDSPLVKAGLPFYFWFLLLIPVAIVVIRKAKGQKAN